MSRELGNTWDDNFASIEEAISVTKYRLADKLYRSVTMIAFSGSKDDKSFMIAHGLILDEIETTLNGNRDAYRKYIQRMEVIRSTSPTGETEV